MIRQQLHENWTLEIAGMPGKLPAQVPGSVYASLLAAGRLEDPFWRDNGARALEIMEHDCTWETRFTPAPGLLACGRASLRFEGIDTLGEVWLNGVPLGAVENMHRAYEFEAGHLLREGENVLAVKLYSPTRFLRERAEPGQADGRPEAMRGFPKLRKAHCMFGWDWAPCLPDAGIWRPVALLGDEGARIHEVRVRQAHENGKVALSLELGVSAGAEGVTCRATLTDPQGEERPFPDGSMCLALDSPQLWWPRGYGGQPLYTVKVEACAGGRVLDRWERRIGLRTAAMHIEKDAYGESFAHTINGVRIFAMGAGYIPEDSLLSRIGPRRTRRLLEDCCAANFNTIRVQGGGCYPDDWFYDICDELGLLVWQDCMFACAAYGLTPAFARNIAAEVEDNVKRLRHHPSLALWCGNSGIELSAYEGRWVSSPRQRADYIRLFEYRIPEIIREHDPDAFYWPASPSSGGGFDDPNSPGRGDAHSQDPGPLVGQPGAPCRYLSACGGPGAFPCLKTVETYTLPEDRNLSSYVMEKHQRPGAAHVQQMFLHPTAFGTALYASQLLQAEAVRCEAERARRNRGVCMGVLYGQVDDCWPGASRSSIDYTGRWKALHYYAKRFFAPVLLSCEEPGLLGQGTGTNAQPGGMGNSIRLCVTNETAKARQLVVRWSLRDRQGRVKREETISLSVGAFQSARLPQADLPEADVFEDYASYQLYQRGKMLSSGAALFSPPKHFRFADPRLGVRQEGDELVVTAKAFAMGVEIQNANEDLVLSDNYFPMDPGQRRVKILRGSPTGLRVRSVYDIR